MICHTRPRQVDKVLESLEILWCVVIRLLTTLADVVGSLRSFRFFSQCTLLSRTTTVHEREMRNDSLRNVLCWQRWGWRVLFWGRGGGSIRANTECIFEVLLQKSDHVERFVDYASKPRLMQRFNERLSEYKQCVAFCLSLSA